jgi:2C-methyl-D-erythritol 2,4-cyclodiphosphate synthase
VKLKEWKAAIAGSIREILAPDHPLPADAVSVKAKTNERCDSLGEGKAIAAHVAVLLEEVPGGRAAVERS